MVELCILNSKIAKPYFLNNKKFSVSPKIFNSTNNCHGVSHKFNNFYPLNPVFLLQNMSVVFV